MLNCLCLFFSKYVILYESVRKLAEGDGWWGATYTHKGSIRASCFKLFNHAILTNTHKDHTFVVVVVVVVLINTEQCWPSRKKRDGGIQAVEKKMSYCKNVKRN